MSRAKRPPVSPSCRSRSTTQWLLAFVGRLLFALFVTGGALPAGGPSAVHGFDIVEEDEHTTASSTQVRALRQAKRNRLTKSHTGTLEVPSSIEPTSADAPPQTWMRPRRTPPPDDDDLTA
jgi:hypothetical protein